MLPSLAVFSQCDPCTAVQVRSEANNGIAKDEILDAAMQALLMGCAARLMHLEVVNEEIGDCFGE